MRVLVAEDDDELRAILKEALASWGYEVVLAADGEAAWRALEGPEAPRLAILDWRMPGLDGLEVCQRVRALPPGAQPYLILLTAMMGSDDVVTGLEAGADDYVTKPFQREELRARVRVGVRLLELQGALAERVTELEEALAQVKQLQGLLPICSWCKKIRDDRNYWREVEAYVAERADVQFTHSVCPECMEKHVEPELERLRRARAERQNPPAR